jgi:hypothetical protein
MILIPHKKSRCLLASATPVSHHVLWRWGQCCKVAGTVGEQGGQIKQGKHFGNAICYHVNLPSARALRPTGTSVYTLSYFAQVFLRVHLGFLEG